MFKLVLMMVLLFPVVCFAAPPSKPSSPSSRFPGNSSFYGASGRRTYNSVGNSTTKRYFTPGGKYLGKEVNRYAGRSSFYGANGRREYDSIGNSNTKRYFSPGGKYLGKEVQYPK